MQLVLFIRICEHVVSANSKALELTGINKDTKQVKGGILDVNEKGEPTGIFRDVARDLIYRVVPEALKSFLKDGFITGQGSLAFWNRKNF